MSTSTGQLLKQAREELSLSIEQVAESTRIRPHYLRALESSEFNTLPSVTQARGFLRSYANFLQIDPEPLIASLETDQTFELSSQQLKIKTDIDERIPKGSDRETKQLEANGIFVEIGQNLKHQREMLGLSLEDVEHHTHLRQHYLKILEAGDLERLPSPVQGRGMLNNYASFLGMNSESVLLRYADGLQMRLAAKQASQASKKTSSSNLAPKVQPSWRRLFSSDFLVGGLLITVLVVFVGWGAIRIFTLSSEQTSTPTAPSIADILLASATPSDTPTPQPPTPSLSAPSQLTPQIFETLALTGTLTTFYPAGVQINVTVIQRAWMRVSVDGNIEFEGRVLPGSAYPFVGETLVEILTGNGAALQVNYNGIDLGQMGNFGEVVNRIFSQQGILNPTPTITPTEIATQPNTPTPIVTMTAQPGEGIAPP